MENNMTLDLKDRKILYELDRDSRRSFSQIGKNVGLKKDVIAYRIKKLEDTLDEITRKCHGLEY